MVAGEGEPVPPPPSSEIPTGGISPRTKIIIAIVAVLLVGGAAAAVFVLTRPPPTVCTLSSTNPLIFDQPEEPDTLDPHVTFSTPGWGIVQQVYQSLVNYNGTGTTTFLPWLAKSWTVSPGGYNYTFVLRQNVHFSNGHPFNAYVMWFSLYRALAMSQDGAFILHQMFWYPGLNYDASASETENATAWMLNNLNTFDFSNPTPEQLGVMMDDNNSFEVIDEFTIRLNMGHGYLGDVAYSALLPAIAGPIASAVDPQVVQANGGVAQDTNPYMSVNMIGTGPYRLQSYSSAGYLLVPDANYWARTVAASEPWNNILQPAKASIQVNFQGSEIVAVQDIKSGQVAGLSFAYVGAAQVNSLQAEPCVAVVGLDDVYSSTAGAWWIFMNQQAEPFSDIHVRKAIAHAIDYNEIIQSAFNGHAKRWVGPVPPGYEHYNPDNLPPYEFNLTKARAEMNLSAWPLPGGFPNPINYMYIKLGAWEQVALLLEKHLARIGIDLVPVGLENLDRLYDEQIRDPDTGECATDTNLNGGPFHIGQEFYTSDYISPDDWTQNNAISYGSANDCMARYVNETVDALVIDAAGESDPAVREGQYANITRLMYDNYTVAWLVVPTQFQVTHKQLDGYVTNAMGAALPFVVVQNTMFAGPPVTIRATVSQAFVVRDGRESSG